MTMNPPEKHWATCPVCGIDTLRNPCPKPVCEAPPSDDDNIPNGIDGPE